MGPRVNACACAAREHIRARVEHIRTDDGGGDAPSTM